MTTNINLHADGSKTNKQVRQLLPKPWDRLSHLLNTIVGICVAWRPARQLPMLDRGVLRNNCVKHRMLSMSRILFAGIAALWGITAAAQSNTIYVLPKFLYNAPNINSPPIYRDSVQEAFADASTVADYCDTFSNGDSDCYSIQNVHPDPWFPGTITFDGIPYLQNFDQKACYKQ